jgi:hypothetical protein
MKIAILFPMLLLGCALEPDDEDHAEIPADDEAASTTTSALCILPQPAPSYDELWSLAPNTTRTGVLDDYGTGECSAYTLAVRNVESIRVRPTTIPTDGDECVGTTISMRKYKKTSSGWSFDGYETATGVWGWQDGVLGCRQLSVYYPADTTGEVRVHVSTSRTSCSGIYCLITRGLSMTATASADVANVPN